MYYCLLYVDPTVMIFYSPKNFKEHFQFTATCTICLRFTDSFKQCFARDFKSQYLIFVLFEIWQATLNFFSCRQKTYFFQKIRALDKDPDYQRHQRLFYSVFIILYKTTSLFGIYLHIHCLQKIFTYLLVFMQ